MVLLYLGAFTPSILKGRRLGNKVCSLGACKAQLFDV